MYSLIIDTLLSLDLGPDDIFYRIRRLIGQHQRVLYVTVDDPNIIPEDKRIYGPPIIRELGKLREWDKSWTTLRVYRDDGVVKCKLDPFLPYKLPNEHVLDK